MNQLGNFISNSSERSSALAENTLPVYGVARTAGLTPAAKYQSKDLSRYKVIRPGMFAYNPMRLNIGSIAYCKETQPIGLVSPDYVVFSCDSKALDHKFMKYAIMSPEWQHWTNTAGVGSVRIRIYYKELATMPFEVPPLPEQSVIAHILGSLDEKIELNRKMNATLEAIAQALFKSWFVDFDPVIDNALAAGNPIPDELAARAEVRRQAIAGGTANEAAAQDFPSAFQQTEELGWIPEGWEMSTIKDTTAAIIDHRGKTPKKLGSDWADSGFPAVSAKNIKGGKLVRKDTIRFTDSDLYERWMAQELNKGDVLMTSEAPLGEKLYLAKKFKWVLSQRLFALRANENLSGVYLYHWLNTNIAKSDIDGRASGTTVQGIRQSELRKVKVLAPSIPCITAFSNTADSLMEKRAINEENSEQLTKLRDTLLPKLISGEIKTNGTNHILK